MADRRPAERPKVVVCITFDNMGEAAELELELWPSDRAIGAHPSIAIGYPAATDILSAHGLNATFFVEGWNADVYPDQIRTLVSLGHEVACHGWRHETWAVRTPAEVTALAARALAPLRGVAGACSGLRPPGGTIPDGAGPGLRRQGIEYVSPVGGAPFVDESGLAVLPFDWKRVDALYFEPLMGGLRQRHTGEATLGSSADWRAALEDGLAEVVASGGCLTVIFHAYLLAEDPERLEVLDWFAATCAAHPDVTVRTARDVARELLTSNPETSRIEDEHV